MSTIISFLTTNLSIVISIIALIISIVNIVYLIITNRKKLVFILKCYSACKVNNKMYYYFDIELVNKSRLPISVNEIIVHSGQDYKFIKAPRQIFQSEIQKGKKITDRYEISSVKFPINISGLCSEQCFIVMFGPDEFNEKVIVILKTNRGNIRTKINKMNELKIDEKNFFEELSKYK